MKIGVLGPVYVNVKIDVEGSFDETGSNTGRASTTYGSIFLTLAEALSDDNEVTFFTSLDTQAQVYILRKLRKHNINTDYIVHSDHGTGFNIEFTVGSEIKKIESACYLQPAVESIKLHEDEIFNDIELMVISNLNSEIIELCRKHSVPVIWLTDKEDIDYLDDSDLPLAKQVKSFSFDDYSELLKEVASV